MKRINLISSPRNLSTALMYSFASRPDTEVIDEPMYAHYFKHSGVVHPGREEVLRTMYSEREQILEKYIFRSVTKKLYFIKNMAHHFLSMDPAFILELENVFLIRDPKLIIRSFAKVIQSPTLQDIGVKMEHELFEYLKANAKTCLVIDSADILKNPEKALWALCKGLDIPFYSCMLSWEKGGRPEDGIWAKYWYKNLHSSTGFMKQTPGPVEIPKELYGLNEEAQDYYQSLKKHALKI